MRTVLQRVSAAEVRVDDAVIGQCGPGLLVLVCAMAGDSAAQAEKMASKVARCRIFKDEADKMNRSVVDVGGSALVISQFTLAADTRSGNRPGFSAAAAPDEGKRLYDVFVAALKRQGVPVETGAFGADMKVSLTNDGPVTIPMEV